MGKTKFFFKTLAAKYIYPALNRRYKKTNHYLNDYIDVCKFWEDQSYKVHIETNLQVVNLGSNHPKFGFDYSPFPIKGDNWAVGPQTLEYDYKILRKYHSFLRNGATVIIPICLFKMFLYRQKPRFYHYKYYTFLSPNEVVGYSGEEADIHVNHPIYYNWHLVKYIFKDVPRYSVLEINDNPLKEESQLIKDAQSWIDCWNNEFDINIEDLKLSPMNKNDIEHNIEILSNIIDFCLERDYRPVIAILPITKYLFNKLPPDYCNNFYLNFIKRANHKNVPLLNYLTDNRFTSAEYYFNSFFMNKTGRRLFTEQVLKDLKLID